MKSHLIRLSLIALLFITLPYITVQVGQDSPQQTPAPLDPSAPLSSFGPVRLYRSESKTVEEVPLDEYLCAVLAGEMQANFHAEALKAQAVAAFTYMIYRYEFYTENPNAESDHPGAYVCDDYHHCKAYLPADKAKEKWGESWYNKYYHNITDAVSSVMGKVITYEGKPINAVFHAISSGKTEDAEAVWGSKVPYLVSADSSLDTAVDGFESRAVFGAEECKEILQNTLKLSAGDDPAKWFSAPQYSAAGTVESISVCGKKFKGTEIRSAFSLRSASFSVAATSGNITFIVHGYGHQVGMSQNGANEMAKTGKTYDEILRHYYKGTEIEDYSF